MFNLMLTASRGLGLLAAVCLALGTMAVLPKADAAVAVEVVDCVEVDNVGDELCPRPTLCLGPCTGSCSFGIFSGCGPLTPFLCTCNRF